MLSEWIFDFALGKKYEIHNLLLFYVPIGEIVWKSKPKHFFTSKCQNHRLQLKYHLGTEFPLWCFHEFWNRKYSSCHHNMQTCLSDLWLQKLPKPSWSLAILDFLHLRWLRVIWKNAKTNKIKNQYKAERNLL